MHRLRFVTGPLAGREVEVTAALVLGRQAADLVVDDPQVSRRHASVRPAGDALEVEDHGSRNGTWVNGARAEGPTRLAPGTGSASARRPSRSTGPQPRRPYRGQPRRPRRPPSPSTRLPSGPPDAAGWRPAASP